MLELWDDFGTDGKNLTSCLEIGDNFATKAEDGNEGVDFYLLVCYSKPFVVKESFICLWGEEFSAGQLAIRGRYYQKWGMGPQNYVYTAMSQISCCHIEDIRAIKFPMVPQTHRVYGKNPIYALLVNIES